jgi:hypothetical protein
MPTKLPVLVAHLLAALCVMVEESVPAENERPAPIVVAATFPVESVRRRELGSVETMRLEVLAVVAERYVLDAYVVKSWWRVEEALLITPPASWSKVEVEFQLVAGVYGKAKSDEEETLLLKVVKSDEERKPFCAPVAIWPFA